MTPKKSRTAAKKTSASEVSSEPPVYRYFLSGDEFLEYARGNWNGLGLHGSTEIAPEVMVHMRLRCSPRGIQVELRRAPPRTRGIRYRLGRLFNKVHLKRANGSAAPGPSGYRPRHVPGRALEEAPGFAPDEIQAGDEPDLAQLTTADWRMTCQALTDERLHIVLYRDRHPDSLVFSGTVARS